jgi:calcineurin-like phosphoesterase family protein
MIKKHLRPEFSTIEEMDEKLISNWNELIKPGDIVKHLGDFLWKGDLKHYVERLNGEIHLIKGNHDLRDDYHKYFKSVKDLDTIKLADNNIVVLCHYALRVWNRSHYGSFHCYGHSHGKLSGVGRSMDVGVDTNNYKPYNLDEVIDRLKDKEFGINLKGATDGR